MANMRLFLLLICLLLASGCAQKIEVSPQSDLDTAAFHYEQGKRLLDEGRIWDAQAAFERAGLLDASYPGVKVGQALVTSAQGDHFRALKLVEAALHAQEEFVDAHIARARVIAAQEMARQRPVDEWMTDVRRSLQRAGQLDPDNGEVPYRQAQIEFDAGDFKDARTALERALRLGEAPWNHRAQELMQRLQAIERAAPGAGLGARIAAAPTISRAELCVLLLEELHVDDLLTARRRLLGESQPPPASLDAEALGIERSWARTSIERLLQLGIPGLEPLPDGGFSPDLPVSRAELAMVADGLLRTLSGNGPGTDRYTGERSRFSDIDSDHFAYAAIAHVVDRGLMAPDAIATSFRPSAPVTGAEALDVLRQLQSAFGGSH